MPCRRLEIRLLLFAVPIEPVRRAAEGARVNTAEASTMTVDTLLQIDARSRIEIGAGEECFGRRAIGSRREPGAPSFWGSRFVSALAQPRPASHVIGREDILAGLVPVIVDGDRLPRGQRVRDREVARDVDDLIIPQG